MKEKEEKLFKKKLQARNMELAGSYKAKETVRGSMVGAARNSSLSPMGK